MIAVVLLLCDVSGPSLAADLLLNLFSSVSFCCQHQGRRPPTVNLGFFKSHRQIFSIHPASRHFWIQALNESRLISFLCFMKSFRKYFEKAILSEMCFFYLARLSWDDIKESDWRIQRVMKTAFIESYRQSVKPQNYRGCTRPWTWLIVVAYILI